MNETNTSSRSKLLNTVMLRRGSQILTKISTRSLVPGIRSGKLFRSDEFSGDGQHWIALGRHHQLSRLFPVNPDPDEQKELGAGLHFFDEDEEQPLFETPPPHIENQLHQLADMLRDINR
jgi:hypothetical protein